MAQHQQQHMQQLHQQPGMLYPDKWISANGHHACMPLLKAYGLLHPKWVNCMFQHVQVDPACALIQRT